MAEQDCFARWGTSKPQMLDDFDNIFEDEYGPDTFRAVDCGPDPDAQRREFIDSRCDVGEPIPDQGYVIARHLNTDDEAFSQFDWSLEPDPDDEGVDDEERSRRTGHPNAMEVSSLRGRLKLCSRGRRVSASGTAWQSSTRSILAAAAWVIRQKDRDLERRMAAASGRTL
ncbi:MAG: hypothetical protein ACHP8B_10855 [Terriglobales bacterium]